MAGGLACSLLSVADAAPAKKKKKAPVFSDVGLAEDKVTEVKAAAESGDTAALRKLGHYYMQQAQDAKGRECFLKAAEAGAAKCFLVILGYKALEHADAEEKNKMDICTKNRKELYAYLEKQAEAGDPAASHVIKMPHLFWTCRPDAAFSNQDENY